MSTNDNPLNCDRVQATLPDWLADNLPESERTELDRHLATCPGCREEWDASRRVWQQLGEVPVPEPSQRVRTQFYAMLETYHEAERAAQKRSWRGILKRLKTFASPGLAGRLAYGLLLLGIGVGLGYWLPRKQPSRVAYEQQIDALSTQVQQMRQLVMLSLLENPSATERLRAVSYTKGIRTIDDRVIKALLTTLNNDPNENVRLVTLEALAELGHDPRVREGLVQSLTRQDSPLVQVALADVMVKLQEKRSLKPLRQLLQQEGTNDLVKSKIRQTIRELS